MFTTIKDYYEKRIEEEKEALDSGEVNVKIDSKQGFAERRSK